MNIIIYTKTGCPWCQDVLELLTKYKIQFEERNCTSNEIYFKELVELSSQTLTPTLIIDGVLLADSDAAAVEDYLKKKNLFPAAQ